MVRVKVKVWDTVRDLVKLRGSFATAPAGCAVP